MELVLLQMIERERAGFHKIGWREGERRKVVVVEVSSVVVAFPCICILAVGLVVLLEVSMCCCAGDGRSRLLYSYLD